MLQNLKMTVNVSLCGSIPRSEMMACSSHQPPLNQLKESQLPALPFDTTEKTRDLIEMAASSLSRKVSADSVVTSSQVIEPPSWAVPPRGDALLEPVGETRCSHRPINLKGQAVCRIGRSEASDMQLLHSASSRRHAVLFHHPNGSCYVVDCGSAHGTYVNGVQVKSSITSCGVMPQRVRKGALIRFGGVGAPSFILKSFTVATTSLLQNLHGTKAVSHLSIANVIEDECKSSTLQTKSDFCLDALVAFNTRLNSVGNASTLLPGNDISVLAAVRLRAHLNSSPRVPMLKKRTLVPYDVDSNEQDHKKLKLSISSESIDSTDSIMIPFVSPTRQKTLFQFDDSMFDRPVVSPNPFEGCDHTPGLGKDISKGILTSALTLDLSSTSKKRKKSVTFSSETEVSFPPTVTPDSASDDEREP